MAALPSSGSLTATHHCCRRRPGSTTSNRCCRSAEYPGEAILRHLPVFQTSTRDTGGLASFSGSPLSQSWPQCWSPQSTRNCPRPPPAGSPVTWLREVAAWRPAWQNQLRAPVLSGCH
nr:pancreatic progenitor cell differentiation and proliferation factor-like [Vicugna pacos]